MKLRLMLIMVMIINGFAYSAIITNVDEKINLREKIDYKITKSNELIFYIDVEASKDEIYTKIIEWANLKFTKTKESIVIIKENKDEGYIMINGFSNFIWGFYPVESVFKIIIDIKDNKIRMTFQDIVNQVAGQNNSGQPNTASIPVNKPKSIGTFIEKLEKNSFLDSILNLFNKNNNLDEKDKDW